jgi:hypothetical protein
MQQQLNGRKQACIGPEQCSHAELSISVARTNHGSGGKAKSAVDKVTVQSCSEDQVQGKELALIGIVRIISLKAIYYMNN